MPRGGPGCTAGWRRSGPGAPSRCWCYGDPVSANPGRSARGAAVAPGRAARASAVAGKARLCGVLGLVLAAGCAGSQGETARDAAKAHDGTWSARATRCKASAAMPGPVREERTREGFMIARVIWGVDRDGSRYEIACFDMPERLDAAGRAEILGRVERGIRARPDALGARRGGTQVAGLPALELHLALTERRVGRYWIFFVDDQVLFEVSVIGPSGERLSAGSSRFFGSFQLDDRPPSSAPLPDADAPR